MYLTSNNEHDWTPVNQTECFASHNSVDHNNKKQGRLKAIDLCDINIYKST